MALMARSIEMSFSASRLRMALRSMSIGFLRPLVCAQVRTVVQVVVQRGELDLYPSRAELGVADLPALTVNVELHSVGVRPGDPSRDILRVGEATRPGMVP